MTADKLYRHTRPRTPNWLPDAYVWVRAYILHSLAGLGVEHDLAAVLGRPGS